MQMSRPFSAGMSKEQREREEERVEVITGETGLGLVMTRISGGGGKGKCPIREPPGPAKENIQKTAYRLGMASPLYLLPVKSQLYSLSILSTASRTPK